MRFPRYTASQAAQPNNNHFLVRRSTSTTVPASAIGAFIGGTFGVLLIALSIFLLWRHKAQKAKRKQAILTAARARVLAQAETPHILRSNSGAATHPLPIQTFTPNTPANLPQPTTVPLTHPSPSSTAQTRLAALTVTDPYANRPPLPPHLNLSALPSSANEASNITETSEHDISRRPSPINADHAEYRARKAKELKAQGYSDTDIILASDFSDGVDPYNVRWDTGGDPYARREALDVLDAAGRGGSAFRTVRGVSQGFGGALTPPPPQKGNTPAANASEMLLPSTVYVPPPSPKRNPNPLAGTSKPQQRMHVLPDPSKDQSERGRTRDLTPKNQRGTPGRTPPPDGGRRKQGGVGLGLEDVELG